MLVGLGIGLVLPSAFALVEWFAPADRQGQFSADIASAGCTGQFLSPLLFGPLAPVIGMTGVFTVAGLAAGGLGLWLLRPSH